ncbi:MAG: SsrA-binding protein SmpB [Pseudomonadota bacterium]|jgi:SsrA-binding protein
MAKKGTKTGARAAAGSGSGPDRKIVATNRKARHDYEILETVEAGIALVGGEVKALRDAKIQLKDGYAHIDRGEVTLLGVHNSPKVYATGFGSYLPERPRKLLLHRSEIDDLQRRITLEHLTLIPLTVYFKGQVVKVELGLAKGRKHHDKRDVLAERDSRMEIERALGARRKGMGAAGTPRRSGRR